MELNPSPYDMKSELKSFDDSKEGVKGLVDSGVTKVPRIFHSGELNNINTVSSTVSNFNIPIIDLQAIHFPALHVTIASRIRSACQNFGFFQVINHGIPVDVLDDMIIGIRRFHEQDTEVKKQFYTRDHNNKVRYFFNGSMSDICEDQPHPANWRDTIEFDMSPIPPKPEEISDVCRDIVIEYSNVVRELGYTIFQLLSEALGLHPFYLQELGCAESLQMMGHYLPPCPEPELTMGSMKHTNSGFINILLQDQLGGLQVFHENQWVDVPPVYGALVVSIGDLLQRMTNEKFISVPHRVTSHYIGPRISIASTFKSLSNTNEDKSKVYGPIKELLSDENREIYKDITIMRDLWTNYYKQCIDEESMLLPFRFEANNKD
ncbi:hypothetical protein Lal_00034182 [Lupinus albus]|uniref:Putative deacetoxyvindoline 4-hydroxylase n=1 Tax=Lupinus albus TaxID=3870 RepID=A0A6A5PHB6_LUPAL|nr:putative deacetoxyvindoline 4-hydroxylase [Lupinus albus]KAF1896484.1 hypothetical protein Lal_00034182 [Lupinus albus]